MAHEQIRSAPEWVIDQYRVERDAVGEIVSDPNRADDEEYIVRLVGQVVAVSVETMALVRALPDLGLTAAPIEAAPAAPPAPKPTLCGATYEQAEADAAHASFVYEDPLKDAP